MTRRDEVRALRSLARAYGVETSYLDGFRRRRHPTVDILIAVLRALGADVSGPGDALRALRVKEASSRDAVDPIAVAWDGAGARVRVPSGFDGAMVEVTHEDGTGSAVELEIEPGPSGSVARIPRLPIGYHWCEIAGRSVLVVSAPRRAPQPPQRSWGMFAPAYALHSDRSWGAGDLTDLRTLLAWVRANGGEFVGTLPLFSAFLDEPFEPSPYAPVSRLFWNEIYIDVDAVPEARRVPDAVEDARRRARELSASRTVDHRGVMAAKRAALEACVRCLDGERAEAFEKWLDPTRESYAAFRAQTERLARPWTQWPDREPERVRDDQWRYHAYSQWIFQQQLEDLSRSGDVYLDLPLGVHPEGFDTWRYPDAFAMNVAAGAPPDAFFTRGQNWGFPPLHPATIRATGYEYVARFVREAMRPSAIARIDHVMGLHRLYWIPDGAEATEGTYVAYPHDELYAILTLEATRANTVIVGEDLGTVPPGVRPTMRRHGLLRSFVLQEEIPNDLDRRFPAPPRASLASINTHDMPTFASFWSGDDIEERERAGMLEESSGDEHKQRAVRREALLSHLGHPVGTEPSTAEVLAASLRDLASSPEAMVAVSAEDLWLETEPQNRPGTGVQAQNWSRRMARSLEQIVADPSVSTLARGIDAARRGKTTES